MIELVATCMFGLEKALGEEIDALGCKRIETIDGRVTFAGEWVDVARANIHLRCAERVLIKSALFMQRALSNCLTVPQRSRGRTILE